MGLFFRAGAKYSVNDTTYIVGMVGIEWFSDEGEDEDIFDDGRWVYALGIGFRWWEYGWSDRLASKSQAVRRPAFSKRPGNASTRFARRLPETLAGSECVAFPAGSINCHLLVTVNCWLSMSPVLFISFSSATRLSESSSHPTE